MPGRERLEITVSQPTKRLMTRWARRMGVSVGALVEYCWREQQSYIREELARIELDIRAQEPNLSEEDMSYAAFEAFGDEYLGAKGPEQ